jgi:uncharacterized protein YndB with AHSA1/START domain
MNLRRWAIFAALAAAASPAGAEVKSSSAAGFHVETAVTVAAPPAEAFAAIGRIAEWWNPQHSYSGKAGNLRLQLRAGGCFCEVLDGGGSVEHLRVVQAQPGKLLRLQGGLGPLQAQAVAGTLTYTLQAVTGGTRITQTYVVGGYLEGGADKLASPVDQVLAEQLQRLQRRLGVPR